MELGLQSCLVSFVHPDAFLCRRYYLRPYLSSARAIILYTRVKFPLLSNNDDDDTTSLHYSTVIARELFVSTFAIVLINLI